MNYTGDERLNVAGSMTQTLHSIAPEATLDEAMEMMDTCAVRHLPVMDGHTLIGILSERDLLEATGWLPRRMREVLEAPSGSIREFMHSPVVTVSPENSLVTASMRLNEWNIGCLPVMRDISLVGILTDADVMASYAKACRHHASSIESDPYVETVMTTDVISADTGTPADEALRCCRERSIRHLPVTHDDTLVGCVSDRDLRMSVGRGQLEGTPVGDLASIEPIVMGLGERLSRAAELLASQRIGAALIVTEGRLAGIVTSTDILRHCTRAFATAP